LAELAVWVLLGLVWGRLVREVTHHFFWSDTSVPGLLADLVIGCVGVLVFFIWFD